MTQNRHLAALSTVFAWTSKSQHSSDIRADHNVAMQGMQGPKTTRVVLNLLLLCDWNRVHSASIPPSAEQGTTVPKPPKLETNAAKNKTHRGGLSLLNHPETHDTKPDPAWQPEAKEQGTNFWEISEPETSVPISPFFSRGYAYAGTLIPFFNIGGKANISGESRSWHPPPTRKCRLAARSA